MISATGTTACALTPGHQQFNACTVYTERAHRINVAVSKSNVDRNRSRKLTPRTPSIDLQALETKARHLSVYTLDTGYGTSRHRTAQIIP